MVLKMFFDEGVDEKSQDGPRPWEDDLWMVLMWRVFPDSWEVLCAGPARDPGTPEPSAFALFPSTAGVNGAALHGCPDS